MDVLRTTVALLALVSGAEGQSFVNFETPLTHPLAISSDGRRLYALNAPDDRLTVFSLADPDAPERVAEIPVGLGPASVAERDADEVWVVNRLSDSISVVSLERACVVATIQVSDEPADVVFAGSPVRAFVSVSGSRQVRVFDPETRGELARIDVFGDEPRALARSSDGRLVWVAATRSGNETTVVPEELAPPPPAPTRDGMPSAPRQSLIVSSEDPVWRETLGVVLPDYDVFELATESLRVVRRYSGVGTILFNVAVDPTRGDLWVANTEARNLVRFEPNLRGHTVDNRVTRIRRDEDVLVEPHDLNAGLDYALLPNPEARDRALAQPTDLCFSPDGETLYVAAFGSDRIGVLDRTGAVRRRIELAPAAERGDPRRMRGPRGLAVHASAPRLYVLNRVANSLSVVDTGDVEAGDARVVREVSLGFDPTPRAIAEGRGFLYSAALSGNGTTSCASCHVDAEWDGLAWDLGDPTGEMSVAFNREIIHLNMHPMKGPMTTQTLRGLTPDTRPFHRRGDRETFEDFNPSFDTLLGGEPLSDADMASFKAFVESLAFPPNPNQNRDRTYPRAPAPPGTPAGPEFAQLKFNGALSCLHCHKDPSGSNGMIMSGTVVQLQAQPMKVPQLRDVYKRTARTPRDGLRMSGFGVLHDGSVDSVFDFLGRPFFRDLSRNPEARRELERFVLAHDTGTAPTVGWSHTVTRATRDAAELAEAIALLEQQAEAGNCALVVKGRFGGRPRGFVFDASRSLYVSDDPSEEARPRGDLLALDEGDALTFLGVPPESGRRIGIDRDEDGVLDGVDVETGSERSR